MMTALQTLKNNGLSNEVLGNILSDIIENDDFEYDHDKRCCVALAWYLGQNNSCDPNDCELDYDETVSIDGYEYRVLIDVEADAAFAEYVESSVWAFNAAFLSGATGLDETVFEALQDKCEDSNDAVLSLIKDTCGLADFIKEAKSADGRGCLAGYDGEENEFYTSGGEYYYLYRMN